MGKSACPCTECARNGNRLHDNRTVKKHTEEISQGRRKRARPNVYGGAPAAADSDGSDSATNEAPEKTDAGWPGEAVRSDSESATDSDSGSASPWLCLEAAALRSLALHSGH